MVQEIGMTGMLRTGIGGRFIQYFAIRRVINEKSVKNSSHARFECFIGWV